MRIFRGELRNFRGGCEIFGGFENFSGGGVGNFRGRGLSREGLIFFGRGDIFSGGVGNFLVAGLRFFWMRLGIIREAGLTFFRKGLRFFWEGLRFFRGGG